MKRTVYRYGFYSVLMLIGLSAIHLFILNKILDFGTQEVIGYLTMLLSMVFVFLGIRYYRNKVNNGYLSFGQGLKIGTLIVLIPAVAFGLFDLLYTQVIDPSWGETYYEYQKQKVMASMPADQVNEKLQDLQKEKEMWSNPVILFLLMTVTVFIIGFIVTIISTLTLMKKKKIQAQLS